MMKVCLASVIAATMLLASDRECQSDRDKIVGCVEKEIFLGFRVETPYKDGKKNGVAKEYYESGKLQTEAPLKDGEQNGVAKQYYESGRLQTETPFKDGKENGVEKSYYENGRLQFKKPYKDGRANGVEKAYYSSSEPFADVIWNNGEITSAKCHNGSIPTSAQLHNFSKSDDLSDLCGETPH